MSNHVNEQILERLFDEVSEMGTGSILRELEGGMFPGVCESLFLLLLLPLFFGFLFLDLFLLWGF